MKTISTSIARIIFAIPLLVFGFFHVTQASVMAGMVPGYLPFKLIWVYATGVALILAGISFIINKKAKMAGFLLAIMLFIFILTIHLPSASSGNQASVTALLKDIGLMAGALMVSGFSKDK